MRGGAARGPRLVTPGPDDAPGALPRNFLRPCLLLLLAEGHAHGYELLDQVAELGLERADPGGLYRLLRTMEREKLVTSWWEPSDAGPPRRTYALADEGEEWLHAWGGSLRESHRLLGGWITRYEERVERGVHR